MKKVFLLFFLFLSIQNFATHIVGGEIIYEFLRKNALGEDEYRITLKIYRDCSAQVDFDGFYPDIPAIITVREVNGDFLVGTYNIGLPTVSNVTPSINNPCITTPNDICVEEGVYTTMLTLPAKTGGYYITYQRCCRNNSINNLLLPGDQGSSYHTIIPGPEDAPANNSPKFKKFPPIYLCANQDFTFDHSATDPDGDSLVYSFYTPFIGRSQCCAYLGSSPSPTNCAAFCPTAAPELPYPSVNYFGSYSGSYPVASSPSLFVNPTTGLLSGRPNLIGQFVVGICAKEYRNGKLINTHYRDFQFNIRACVAQVTSDMEQQVKICEGSFVTFSNTSRSTNGKPKAFWDFGVANINSDTSSIFNPSFNFPDTGKYIVTLISDPGKPCTDTIRRVFAIYPKLDVHFPTQAKQCLDSNYFQFNAEGDYPSGSSFHWTFGATASPSVSFDKNPEPVSYKNGGHFAISLLAKFGPCEASHRDTITVIDIPDHLIANWDTSIVIGEVITLNAYGGPGYTYTWTPVIDYLNCAPCNFSNPQSMPLQDIVYTVLTEEPQGCFITSRNYTVLVEYKTTMDVPSAFTPNGDGINDLVYVDGWGIKKLLHFKIFNRWGQLVFETTDLKTGWDGRYNGIPQNMETYVYQASVETFVKEEPIISKTGTLKLIR